MKYVYIIALLIYQFGLFMVNRKHYDDITHLIIGLVPIAIAMIGALS